MTINYTNAEFTYTYIIVFGDQPIKQVRIPDNMINSNRYAIWAEDAAYTLWLTTYQLSFLNYLPRLCRGE